MPSTDHVPRLCPACTAPLTARLYCWQCKVTIRKKPEIVDPFVNDLGEIWRMIRES